MRLKKEKAKVEAKTDKSNEKENINLMNIITPMGISHTANQVMLNDTYGTIKAVTKYPESLEIGWLSKISNIEGTSTVIEYQPADHKTLIELYDKQYKKLSGDYKEEKEISGRQMLEKKLDDISKIIKSLNEKNDMVGYMNIMLFPQAFSEIQLEHRIRNVDSIVGQIGGSTNTLVHKQLNALKCIAPYGMPNQEVANIGERNTLLSTFLGGFYMACSGLNDNDGFYLGKTSSGKIILLNMWLRGQDRNNSNWLITGMPGVGKSATVKNILLKDWALGSKVIIIDPEQEYIEMAKKLNGDVVDCAGGKNGKINPLQIRKVPKMEENEDEDKEKDLNDLYPDEGYGMSDLAMHLQTLKVFFKLYIPDISSKKLAILEKELINLYEKYNITWKTDIETLKNEEFPIMSDLYKHIMEKTEGTSLSNKQKDDYTDLLDDLYSISHGADSFIFNGYTDIQVKSSFIVLDNSKMIDVAENLQRSQYYNTLSWCWQQVSKNRKEKTLLAVDEAYLMVDPNVPQSIGFLRNMSKRMRKYSSGLLVITHSVSDLLDPAVKRYGQSIIDSACYKILMGTEGKNLQETKALFRLSEKEETLLASQQRGRGLLYAGSVKLHIQIDIGSKFLEIMGRAGGE